LPEFRGLVLGIALIVAAIVLGFALRRFLPSPVLSGSDRGVLPDDYIPRVIVYGLYLLVTDILPSLIALIMLWMAFVRGDVRDRYLWNAAMVYSSLTAAGLLDYLVRLPAHRFLPTYSGEFVNPAVVCGAIAYGALHFALARGGSLPVRGAVAVVALIVLFALPIATGILSWATMLCSFVTAGGIWAIGVWIADRAGFDVYGSGDART
jgi:hypothetical protein